MNILNGTWIQTWANKLDITEPINGSWIQAISYYYEEFEPINGSWWQSVAKGLDITEPVNGSWQQAISYYYEEFERVNGSWIQAIAEYAEPIPPEPFSISGGTVTMAGEDQVHTFTSGGTFSVTGSGEATILIASRGGTGLSVLRFPSQSGRGGDGGSIGLRPLDGRTTFPYSGGGHDAGISSGIYTVVIDESNFTTPSSLRRTRILTPTAEVFMSVQGFSTTRLGGALRTTQGNGSAGSAGFTSNITGSNYIYGAGGGGGAYTLSVGGGYNGVAVSGGARGGDARRTTQINYPESNRGQDGPNFASGGGGAGRTEFDATTGEPNDVSESGGFGGQGVVIIRWRPNSN